MDIRKIVSEISSEPNIFINKSYLDHFIIPPKIIGRTDKAKELIRMLLGFKQDYVPSVISVYGRSGTGKSCLTRKVCEELVKTEHDFKYVCVNFRECRSVFGAVNLILQELGAEKVSSAKGIDFCFDLIQTLLEKISAKSIVIVMDEFDSILSDKRYTASDLLYRFLTMREDLREKGVILSVLTISNNMLSHYDLDDRVKSRMGSVELYFNPYSSKEIYEIISSRASRAFIPGTVSDDVLKECAMLSAEEHGDARRATDLLKFAGEVAMQEGRKSITKGDLLKASDMIQQDLIKLAVTNRPRIYKFALISLCEVTFRSKDGWVATSQIYEKYRKNYEKIKPLGYRRFSDILGEFQDSGLCITRTISKGRNGYGKEYKLIMDPSSILPIIAPDLLEILKSDLEQEKFLEDWKKGKFRLRHRGFRL